MCNINKSFDCRLTESESATEEADNDILVNNVMAELKSLARSMRRVSISK